MSTGNPRGSTLLGDTSPLLPRPSVRDLRAYDRAMALPWYRGAVGVSVMWAAGLVIIVALTVWALGSTAAQEATPGSRALIAVVPLAYAAFTLVVYAQWLMWRSRDVRMWQFARANGHRFQPSVRTGGQGTGAVVERTGFSKRSSHALRGVVTAGPVVIARNIVVGNGGRGRDNTRRPFAFAVLELPVDVPRAVLRNPRSRLVPYAGLGLGTRARLSVDGASGGDFALLAPRDDEAAARAFFTPRMLSAIVGVSGACEAELVGREFYLYFRFGTPVWKPEVMDRLEDALAIAAEASGAWTGAGGLPHTGLRTRADDR